MTRTPITLRFTLLSRQGQLPFCQPSMLNLVDPRGNDPRCCPPCHGGEHPLHSRDPRLVVRHHPDDLRPE